MATFSEKSYALPELWFTGKQWDDGTEKAAYRKLYRARKKELRVQSPPPNRKDRQFKRWFLNSLWQEDHESR